jgi:hypothetical protein
LWPKTRGLSDLEPDTIDQMISWLGRFAGSSLDAPSAGIGLARRALTQKAGEFPGSQPDRAVRVDMRRVRLGRAEGILLNLSATGAMVRAPLVLPVGARAVLVIKAETRPVELKCRVVRCAKAGARPEGAPSRTEFDLAVSFERCDALATLLRTIVQRGRRRHLLVSLERRCPSCHGRPVSKVRRMQYFCDKCHLGFDGFRVGPLRIAFVRSAIRGAIPD